MDILAFFGVDPTGKTPEQIGKSIRKAYRCLAFKYHPDRGGDPAEFRKLQDAYDLFKSTAPHQQGALIRPVNFMFAVFRDFLLTHPRGGKFDRSDVLQLAQHPAEESWFRHFVQVASEGTNFIVGSGPYYFIFLDKTITLPRFYRAYSMSLSKEDPLFIAIQKMFCKDLPWDYWLVKDYLDGRK